MIHATALHKCAAAVVRPPSLRGAPIEQELLRQAWLGRGGRDDALLQRSVRPLLRTTSPVIGSDWQNPSLRRLRKSTSDLICRQARFLSERPIMSHFAPTREMASFLRSATAPRPTRARWGISQLRPKNKAVEKDEGDLGGRMRLGTDRSRRRRAHHPVLTEVKSKPRPSGDRLGEIWTCVVLA